MKPSTKARTASASLILIILVILIGFNLRHKLHAIVVTDSPSPSASVAPNSPAATDLSTPSTQASTPACATADLTLVIGPSSGAAGHSYYPIEFTNKSSAACTLYGYPGVSLVDASGTQLGQPATRAASSPALVTIDPGIVAHATLELASAGNFDPSACTATSASLKVFPPGQTTALTAPFAAQSCGDFSVQAITTGAHDQ